MLDESPWYYLQYFDEGLSINNAYWARGFRGKGGRITARVMLDHKAIAYKEWISRFTKIQFPQEEAEDFKSFPHYAMIAVFYGNFFYKKADRYRRRDLTNMIKLTEDGICDGLGIDDKGFGDVSLHKIAVREPDAPRIVFCVKGYSKIPDLQEAGQEVLVQLEHLRSRSSGEVPIRGCTRCSGEILPRRDK